MKRIILFLVACAGMVWAHHSYPKFYFTDQRVTLKGQVTKVVFDDPHAVLTIETKESGIWLAEWTKPSTLRKYGVQADTVRTGDFLEIQGSPARDPKSRVVSALKEIRRPADGWRWELAGQRTIE